MAGQADLWDRLAATTKPSGVLLAMENPRSIVWMAFVWTLGSMPGTIGLAALFFWFDEPTAGLVNVGLTLAYAASWFVYVATGSVRGTFLSLAGVSTVGLSAVHFVMGGYANSGAILMWGIPMTTIAVLLLKRGEASAVGGLVVAMAVIFGFADEALRSSRPAPDPTLPTVLFTAAIVMVTIQVIPVIGVLVGRLNFERERAEDLLLNVLPAEVDSELKETGATETRRFESISVLFADIVGFTPIAAHMEPEEMVNQLNEVFTHFDTLAEKNRCEKIRTIGDAYMVAAGVPTPRDDHARDIASMALEMMEYARTTPLTFRIGINSGPVVAGVVGTSKFQYDIWGDTVNTASRMESHGEADRIQIAEGTYQLIKDDFDVTLRGVIEVKGKGDLNTWYLDGELASAEDHPRT